MTDTPKIVILGAGPIGLEATLYARFLGYKVTLLERASTPAANLQDWGHVKLFTPFSLNASTLGVAAIGSQLPDWQCPSADALLTGAEFLQQYLEPLAKTDLIASSLQTGVKVLALGKTGWLKTEGVGNPDRAEAEFQILTRRADGSEETFTADIVIDCTGTYGNHNHLGSSGIPAIGESTAANHITYNLPDPTGRDRDNFLGKHTLIIGAGYSAATVITQLAQLAAGNASAETKATWITRNAERQSPLIRIPNDRLIERDTLAATANQFAADSNGPVTHCAGTTINSIDYRSSTDDFQVELDGEHPGIFTFDRIVANVGYHPDNRLYTELQLHECYASSGPMKLAAALLVEKGIMADCLDQTTHGPESLVTTEPNFYILGSKSYGRNSNFLLSLGHEQICDLFTIIGQREDLDLYATMPAIDA